MSESAEVDVELKKAEETIEEMKLTLEQERQKTEEMQSELSTLREDLKLSQDKNASLEGEATQAKAEIERVNGELSSKLGELDEMQKGNENLAKEHEGLADKDKAIQELSSRLAEAEALNNALNSKLEEVERTPNGKQQASIMRRMSNGVQSAFSNESTPSTATPESRWSEGGTPAVDTHMSELDKQQRELEVKKHKLMAEKQGTQQNKVLEVLLNNKDFHDGMSLGACTTFKCLLHWNAFQAERTTIFDKIIQSVGSILEESQDNNDVLAHWLTNSVTLLALFRRFVRPPSESGIQRRSRAPSGLFAFRSSMIFSRSPAPDANAQASQKVEAKYPALLFKQQLDAFVQKIFSLLRDNIKKDIAPTLNHCIHAPRGRAASTADKKQRNGPVLSNHWTTIINILQSLLQLMRDTHVPKFLVRKLFQQIFAFINVQLFNQLLLRRECCSFSNGEYVKTGLAEIENWIHVSKTEFVGSALEELKQIRQAVSFLVIHQKPKKTLEEITNDLCPILSVQQLYRISTMYWDDKYGTETVSGEVLSRMKRMMVEDSNSSNSNTSFLLDDDPSVPFSWDQLTVDAVEMKIQLKALPAPGALRNDSDFTFL
jgi:myosin-5